MINYNSRKKIAFALVFIFFLSLRDTLLVNENYGPILFPNHIPKRRDNHILIAVSFLNIVPRAFLNSTHGNLDWGHLHSLFNNLLNIVPRAFLNSTHSNLNWGHLHSLFNNLLHKKNNQMVKKKGIRVIQI